MGRNENIRSILRMLLNERAEYADWQIPYSLPMQQIMAQPQMMDACEEDSQWRESFLTITTDNGSEFSQHKLITKALKGVTVYFADPYASWQKGLMEYTNKLIRQYILKNSDFDEISPIN